MDSKALALVIDPILLNAMSSDEDVVSVSSQPEIPAPQQYLDEQIAETSEESRLLIATKKMFQQFYTKMNIETKSTVPLGCLVPESRSRKRAYTDDYMPPGVVTTVAFLR